MKEAAVGRYHPRITGVLGGYFMLKVMLGHAMGRIFDILRMVCNAQIDQFVGSQ